MSDSQRVPEEGRTPGIEPRFFTLEDVAIYLNVSVPQVYSLVRSRELPPSRSAGEECGASIASNWTPISRDFTIRMCGLEITR